MRVRFALLAAAAALMGPAHPGQAAPKRTGERRLTVFYTASVHGALEPCGCTSDPLGDVARLATVVRAAKAERDAGVLLVDGGNLSYPPGAVPGPRREVAALKAKFLASELGKLGLVGSALGEADVTLGNGAVHPKRLAANLRGAEGTTLPGKVITAGDVRVGVLGIAGSAAAELLGARATDPAAAAAAEADRLRKAGAELVIALAAVDRPTARKVARAGGIDIVVVGQGVGPGLPVAEQVGRAFLVAPQDELQRVGRLDVVLRDGSTDLIDAGGEEALSDARASAQRRLTTIEGELARWTSDRNLADAAFVARKTEERDRLRAEVERLEKASFTPPASGSYFTNRLVPLRRAIPRDKAIAASMRALDRAIAAANLRVAEPPPPAEPGRAAYVGDKACAACHKPEIAFWKKTVHANAWRTLVAGGKAADLDCVSCHATGFGEVGGSSLGHTKGLESVQCEVCHGPGSLHVKAEGLDEPPTVRLETAESTCKRCHNEKHSDTFDYVAYLRDILGPGHGEGARAKLGQGPTGRELRRAAMAKARAAGAEQLKKL